MVENDIKVLKLFILLAKSHFIHELPLNDIYKNFSKLKNMDECTEILEYLYKLVEDDDVDRIIALNELKCTIYTINDEKELAERILMKSYNLAKEDQKLKKAADISIKISKFYMDNKEEELGVRFLEESVKLFKSIGVREMRWI